MKNFKTTTGVLLFFLLLLNIPKIRSQAVTHVVSNSGTLMAFIPLHSDKIVPTEVLPSVDVAAALAEDALNGIEAPRFAVKIPTFFAKSDGDVEIRGSKAIWKATFRSTGAVSLNFQFKDLKLPESAQLFIYNRSNTMVIGPINQAVVFDGKFNSDLVSGDEATVEVIMPKANLEGFDINIAYVNHGFQEIDFRGFGDSAPCQTDINCTFGSGGGIRDAVALILIDGDSWCSGALINDVCGDSKSYFLTADHCVHDSQAGNVSDWVFRFNYDSPGCTGLEPTGWFSFSGATLKASSSSSADFALLELNASVIGYSNLSLAGWNRNDFTPNTVVCIHHPSGDVKKVNTATPNPTTGASPVSITDDSGGNANSNFYTVSWTTGMTEGGSSGSPLFSNNLIIGDMSRAPNGQTCTTSPRLSSFGRFFTSWTGGGTSSTRLSSWLDDGSGTTMTLGTIHSPYISGTSPVCTTNQSFTLQNPNCSTVSWVVTPTSLFATTGGASTSGSTTTATLRANSSTSTGAATLTFTITNSNSSCSPVTVNRTIWIGKPGIEIIGDDYLCTRDRGFADLNYLSGTSAEIQGTGSVPSWTYNGPLTNFTIYGDWVRYIAATTPGYGTIGVSLSNACGTSTAIMPYQVVNCDGDGGGYLIVGPNPSNGIINLQFDEKILIGDAKTTICIYDKTGKVVFQTTRFGLPNQLDVSMLESDVYFLEVKTDSQKFKQKLVVIQ